MKIIKKFTSIVLALMLAIMAVTAVPITAEATDDFSNVNSNKSEPTNNLSYEAMDSDNAIMFIGFITNNSKLTENQIKNSDAYKILTNTYSGNNKEAKKLALKIFIETHTAAMADGAKANMDFLIDDIVYYLEKNVPNSGSTELTGDIINKYKNQYSKLLVEGIKDIVDIFFQKAGSCFQISDVINLYSPVENSIEKAKKILNYTIAAIEGICLVFEAEIAGRYGYFQCYLEHRPTWDSQDDEIFKFIMSYNQLAFTDSYWLASLLDGFNFITHKDSFLNHFDVLDYWAEFTYRIGLNVTEVSFNIDSYTMFANQSFTATATAYPLNAIEKNISYYSSNTSIATIDKNTGKVTPTSFGKVKITATTDNGVSDEYTLEILPFNIKSDGNTFSITKYIGNDTDITIPLTVQGKKITSIGSGAFAGCTSLTNITIPDSVTSIDNWAFDACRNLTNITIPNSVTSIGDCAFYGCKNLMSITIPDSITSIGHMVFYDCTNLMSITIPDSVTSISSQAFFSCTSLMSITIPDSITSIGSQAFYDCTSLTSIIIPDSVTSIGYDAFGRCTSLTSITVDENNTEYSSLYGNLYNKDKSELIQYAIGKTETSFSIPNSVTSIGGQAFYDCTNLTSITIPNSVTSIGYGAFTYCTSLTSITIPDNVTNIDSMAFYNTAYYNNRNNWDNNVLYIGKHLIVAKGSIKGSYSIKNGTITIADGAFDHCTSLTSITIPNSVTNIGEIAFNGCSNLKDIYYPKSAEDWNCITIGSYNDGLKNAKLHFIGDVNQDGEVDITDATAIQRHLAHIISLDEEQLKVADTNSDGWIDITDVTRIQKYLAEMIPSLG